MYNRYKIIYLYLYMSVTELMIYIYIYPSCVLFRLKDTKLFYVNLVDRLLFYIRMVAEVIFVRPTHQSNIPYTHINTDNYGAFP